MKKILLLLCIVFGSLMLNAQNLTFELRNPRIFRFNQAGNKTFLRWDVYVKASTTGTYLYGSQLAFNINGANFVTVGTTNLYIDITSGFLAPMVAQGYWLPPNKGFNGSNKIGFGIALDGANLSGALYEDVSTEVPTTFSKLATIGITISNSSGIAGITFDNASMPGGSGQVQQYGAATQLVPAYSDYSVNSFSGRDFSDLYLARIFCGEYTWSQYSTTVMNQSVDWTVNNFNTSVWDTTTIAATIPSANVILGGLRIHQGGSLKINPATSVTCSGATEIKEAKGLVIAADATGFGQFLDNGTITYAGTGSAEADVFLSQDKWHHYSPAVQLASYQPYLKMYMKYYNEYDPTNAPIGMTGPFHSFKYISNEGFSPDTTMLPVMTGYAMWSASSGPFITNGLARPAGALNTGLKSYTVNRSPYPASPSGPLFDGWNLIGNPYSSAIDLSSASVTWGNTEQTAWFWNPTGGNYLTYIKGGSGTKATSIAAAQQGFFVHHTTADAIPTTFSLTNAVRTINAEPFLKTTADFADMLNLEASTSAGLMDKAVVRLAPDASNQYEESIDASKMWGLYEAPQLYSILPEEQYLTVNVLPWAGDSQVVPMGFYCGVSGDFKITASNLGSFGTKHVYLEDKETAQWQELSINPVYNFHYEAGEDQGRFVIHFMAFPLGTTNLEMTTMKIYSNEENLYVMNVDNTIQKGKVELFDMTGRKVFAADLMNNKVSKYNPNVVEAYYAVKVTTQSGTYSQKVYLR